MQLISKFGSLIPLLTMEIKLMTVDVTLRFYAYYCKGEIYYYFKHGEHNWKRSFIIALVSNNKEMYGYSTGEQM